MLGQLIISGIVVGSLYAMVGLGMVMIYKTSEVLNFAQGEIGMFSTFAAYLLLTSYGLPFPAVFAGVCLFAFCLGALIEFGLLRRAKDPTTLGLIIITLGVEMILYGAAGWLFGTDIKSFPSPFSTTIVYHIGGVVVSQLNIIVVAVCLSLMGLLALFFRYTRLGVAMKATSQNPVAARVCGIRTHRIFLLAWGISSVLGAVAGMLIAPITLLDPNMMLDPLLKGFASAVLGGMESLPGTALGAWILGIVENLVGGYVSTEFKSTVAFLVIVVVLCVRPSGLFAKHRRKKV